METLLVHAGQAVLFALSETDVDLAASLQHAGFDVVELGDVDDLGSCEPELVVVVSADLDDRRAPTLRQLRQHLKDAVIVCVLGPQDLRIEETLAAGADTIVETGDSFEVMFDLALQAARAGYVVRPRSTQAQVKVGRPLSARERQTLAMVTLGFSNGAIAQKLHISESTVKSHLSSSFAKLGVRTRAEATAKILTNSDIAAGILAMPGQRERLSISRLDRQA